MLIIFGVTIEYLNKYSRAHSYILIGLLHISCDGRQEADPAEPEGQGHHLRERVHHDHQVHRVAALRHVLHEGEVTRGHFADSAYHFQMRKLNVKLDIIPI